MADPFIGTWDVTFSEMTGGNPPPPDPFPFGTTATVIITDQLGYFFTVKPGTGGPYTFEAFAVPDQPNQIKARGDIVRDGPLGTYNFLGFFVGDLVVQRRLVIGAYTWEELEGGQTPGDDPPATGGWVGGPESPT